MGIELGIEQRISERMKASGIKSWAHLSEITGYSRGYLSDVKRGRSTPSGALAESIASALGTSVEYLLRGEKPVPQPKPQSYILVPSVRAVCVAADAHTGGWAIKWDEGEPVPVETRFLDIPHDTYKIVTMPDDSMSPRIHTGDRLICQTGTEVKNGDIAAVFWEGRVLVRGYLADRAGGVALIPISQSYLNINTRADDPRICPLGRITARLPRPEAVTGFW